MRPDVRRAALLAAFWVPYCVVPVVLGLFELPGAVLYWDEAARLALSLLGYGLVGSGFYAVTGSVGDRTERFLQATGVSVALTALATLYACSVTW